MSLPFKLSRTEYEKVKNHPIHYNLDMRWLSKEGVYEGEAPDQRTITTINEIINS